MTDNLLLVEDDPGSQELVRALCAARGYGVDVAGDGFLGLRLLSERRHAIVLIDYHLPEMDGFALARLMREIVAAQGTLKLVGITADRHGLASRRGSDALFDAILVKPLDPDLLYATLDRLKRPDETTSGPATVSFAAAEPAVASHAADALWRRRGLRGRPRAVLCPELGPDPSAAVGQAFELCAVETAEVILVGESEGLDDLHRMRKAGPGRLLPAIDLTGQFRRVCDLPFRVDDAGTWDRLAQACHDFAARRTALSTAVRDAEDPATRLLAFLYVGDRALSLSACADQSVSIAETGLSRAAVMAAILSLTGAGWAICEAAVDGVVVRLTDAGLAAATHGAQIAPALPPSAVDMRAGEAPVRAVAAVRMPRASEDIASNPAAIHATGDLLVDERRTDELRRLIGDAPFERLLGDLLGRLRTAFPPDAPLAALKQEAHTLIATAGSLGFLRLSSACRDIEMDIASGKDATLSLRIAKDAITSILEHLQ